MPLWYLFLKIITLYNIYVNIYHFIRIDFISKFGKRVKCENKNKYLSKRKNRNERKFKSECVFFNIVRILVLSDILT